MGRFEIVQTRWQTLHINCSHGIPHTINDFRHKCASASSKRINGRTIKKETPRATATNLMGFSGTISIELFYWAHTQKKTCFALCRSIVPRTIYLRFGSGRLKPLDLLVSCLMTGKPTLACQHVCDRARTPGIGHCSLGPNVVTLCGMTARRSHTNCTCLTCVIMCVCVCGQHNPVAQ